MAKAPPTRAKISLFLDSSTHEKAKHAAIDAGLSLTRYIEAILVNKFAKARKIIGTRSR